MKRRIPMVLCLLNMFGGVLISIFFATNEPYFKQKIESGLNKNKEIINIFDKKKKQSKFNSERSKIWRYYQRYHFHATAIGAMSLGVVLVLNFLVNSNWFLHLTSYLVSLGGLAYPFTWLAMGYLSPQMGRDVAHQKVEPLAYSGGVFLVGLLFAILILLSSRSVFEKSRAASGRRR